MTLIAHISDVHLSPLPAVRFGQLLNKRMTGYINWKMKRRDKMNMDSLEHLMLHLQRQKPDMITLTGDLVNLALPEEIESAGDWLQWLAPHEKLCVSPGNHDAYVTDALRTAQKLYGNYISGETLDNSPFPFVRRVNDVAIISCSSAVTTPPFCSAGYFDSAQADRLDRILGLMGNAGYFRAIMIHHPPNKDAEVSFASRLYGSKRFRQVIEKNGAELILHGHTHASSISSIDGKDKSVPVIGVASASAQGGSGHPPARYNLFQIHKSGAQWSCTMREYGYQRIGDDIVQRLQLRIY